LCTTKGKFDLKGSWVDRESSATSSVKKDLNFIKDYRKVNLLKLNSRSLSSLNKILEKDVEFFKQNNIMDYSLLVGIEEIKDS